jgi:hypothetical protein
MAAAAAMAGETRWVRPPFSLASFEIAIAGRGAALSRFEFVGIHGQAHAAARFAPIESSLDEDAIQTLRPPVRLT